MTSKIIVNTIEADTGISSVTFASNINLQNDSSVLVSSSGVRLGTGSTIAAPSANELALSTNSAERLRITSAGLVGIGTDSPANILHLSSTGTPTIQITDEDNSGIVKIENGSGSLFLNADTGNTVSNSRIQFGIDGSERLRMDSTGRVGINTTTYSDARDSLIVAPPSGQTDVFFTIKTLSTNGNTRLQFADPDDTNVGDISYTHSNNAMVFKTSDSERLRITSAGNIGINETSPNGKLHIGNLATGAGNVNVVTLDRDDGTLIYGIDYNGSSNLVSFTGNNKHFAFANKSGSVEAARILSTGGLTFNGDTATANALDDYEEGSLSWRLQRSDNIGAGSNVNTRVTYTKIGNRVYISGYIYTQNTGSSTSNVNIIIRSDSNTSNVATLPYPPNHSGGLPVTGTRTISDLYRNMAVTFQENSSTVYLYRDDGDNNYVKNTNNVAVSNSQTHLVLQFCGSYTTNS